MVLPENPDPKDAEHQPFTQLIETVRGLLLGTAIGKYRMARLEFCAQQVEGT